MLPSKPWCSHQPQLQRCIKLVRDKGKIRKMHFWDLVAPSRKIRREEEDDKDGDDYIIFKDLVAPDNIDDLILSF